MWVISHRLVVHVMRVLRRSWKTSLKLKLENKFKAGYNTDPLVICPACKLTPEGIERVCDRCVIRWNRLSEMYGRGEEGVDRLVLKSMVCGAWIRWIREGERTVWSDCLNASVSAAKRELVCTIAFWLLCG